MKFVFYVSFLSGIIIFCTEFEDPMSENKGKVKYGILCPSTNLFYEVPDEATYLALLQELQQKAMEPKIQKNKSET